MVKRINLPLRTQGNTDMIDLTDLVQKGIKESNLSSGMACIFVPGSTCGITTIEFEPGCLADFKKLFDEIIPKDQEYQHHLRWGDGNGHSHIRSALLGPSFTFPFEEGKALLGTWQQIILVDFDNRPRKRNLILQLIGE